MFQFVHIHFRVGSLTPPYLTRLLSILSSIDTVKMRTRFLLVMKWCLLYSHLRTNGTWQTFRYAISISEENVLTSYIPLVQIFTANTHHTTFNATNHPYSLRISLENMKLYSGKFFSRTASQRNNLPRKYFHDRYNLNHINSRRFPIYTHNLQFLLYLLTFIAQQINKPLLLMVLRICI